MRIILLISILVLLSSCSSDDETNQNKPNLAFDLQATQTWNLEQMTSSADGSETTGEDMEWQESYVFNPDFTFNKTRVTSIRTFFAEGSFTLDDGSDTLLLILSFTNPNDIVGSCSGQQRENLLLSEDLRSLRSNWIACDGPSLFYERTQ